MATDVATMQNFEEMQRPAEISKDLRPEFGLSRTVCPSQGRISTSTLAL